MSFITQLGNWLRKISTSITSLSVSGRTITYTRHNGDTGTIQTQDTTYSDATQNAHGLMSASDKAKLDGVATGAEVNQNAYSNIKVGNTTIAADGKTDTLELVAGSNVTLTPDATNDKVTIAATDTVYTIGTASGSGNAITALSISGSTITPTLGKTFSESTHTHSYLPLSGGTMTGGITFSEGASATSGVYTNLNGKMAVNDLWRIASGATASNAGYLEIATADDGSEPIYVRQYTGVFATVKRTLTLLDASGNSDFPGGINATSFNGYTIEKSVPSNAVFTDTHWTSHLYAGASNGVAHAATTNGNTHLILCDNSTARNRIKITGTGATTVTSDANGVITIHSTDNNTVYTHPTTAGNKHIPSGGSSGQFLKYSASGTATWAADNNTTYSNMSGASSSAAGKAGLVPAPAKGAQAYYLAGNATWKHPNTLLSAMFGTSGVGGIQVLTSNTLPKTGTYLYWGRQLQGDNVDEPICGVKAGGSLITRANNYYFSGWCIRIA